MNEGLNLLFPTPFYYGKTRKDNFDLIQSELDAAYEFLKPNFGIPEAWGHTHLLSDPNFKSCLFENENFKLPVMIDEIAYQVYQYMTSMMFDKSATFNGGSWKFQSSWFAQFDRGHYGHVHNHGSADIAGVYYYKVDDSHPTFNIRCTNPSIEQSHICHHLGYAIDTAPEVGDFYLFPGFVPHAVKCNETDSTRISVSFNINFLR